jgi:TPR repeat protein
MNLLATVGTIVALLLTSCASGDLQEGIKSHKRNDYEAAASMFRRASASGNAEAQRRLALMYYHGEGVTQDNSQAVALFESAAEGGDAESASDLARMYEFGMGVAQDDTRAATWFLRAAELGEPSSQFRLSVMLFQGQGVTKDRVEAAKWWTIAMAPGGAAADRIRVSVESAQGVLSPAEIAEGRRRAEEWIRARKAQQ